LREINPKGLQICCAKMLPWLRPACRRICCANKYDPRRGRILESMGEGAQPDEDSPVC